MMTAWWRYELAGLAQALREKAVTAEALLDHYLERIGRIDPRLNTFVALDEAGARAAARTSDARLRAELPLSPLDGIPISVKDNLLVAGLPATWGSRALADFRPDRDELPVARLRAAGAVMVGKTNVPELTVEGYTRNDLFGVTRNPWDPARTPGGSSGGAAAGGAAGLVAAALCTDGGGSTRRPACHTGLVGFKPSIGRVPRADGFPPILTDFEVVGTLARRVDDIRLLDQVLAGPEPRDRNSLLAAAPRWNGTRRRILYLPRFGTSPVDPEVEQATAAVASQLAAAGHEVRDSNVFFDLEAAARVWYVISRAGVAWLAARDGGRIGQYAGTSVQAMIADGVKVTGAEYADALDQVAALRRRVADLFTDVDLVLTPTAAALPWLADEPYPSEIAGRAAGPRDHAVFTGWVNLAGLPAISLPVALSRNGLPIGVQLAAGFGADEDLIEFAEALQVRTPPPSLPDP